MEASLAAWGCRLRIESEAEEPDLEVWKAVHDIAKAKSCKMPQDLHALVERLPYVICRRVVIRAPFASVLFRTSGTAYPNIPSKYLENHLAHSCTQCSTRTLMYMC